MKNAIVFLLILVLGFSLYGQNNQIPHWFQNPPTDDSEYIYSVSAGSSQSYALLFALSELSNKLDSKVKTMTKNYSSDESQLASLEETSKIFSNAQFNHVKVSQMTTTYTEADMDYSQVVCRLTYTDGDNSLEVKGFIEDIRLSDSDDTTINYNYSDTGKGCNISDIFNDLQDIGIVINKACTDDQFYVLIKYPLSLYSK